MGIVGAKTGSADHSCAGYLLHPRACCSGICDNSSASAGFRLRLLHKVNIEGVLIATEQNLKRLLRWRGWGRRWWPGGAAGLRIAGAIAPLRPVTA